MINNDKFNGKQLKTARLLRGLTLTELAKITELSKQSISLYENCRNTPDYSKLCILSQKLNIPVEFFFHEDTKEIHPDTTYFRSLTSTTTRNRTSQIIKLELVTKMYDALKEYIEFPKLNIPPVQFDVDDEFESSECIEKISMQLRKYWNLGTEPIDNLQFTLESNGIVVTGFNTFENKIDAFSQKISEEQSDIFFIAVAIGERSESRIRFDMAHELGHILLHPWSESIELIPKEEFKLRERQANMFASAFLLPKESFGKEVSIYPTNLRYYQDLKKKWNVSMQAMIYRANQLGIITNSQFQYMIRQININGWKKKEPYDNVCKLNDNLFQGAISVLLENKVLDQNQILQLFYNHGIILEREDIENFLGLRKNSLLSEQSCKIIPLKLK